MAEQTGTCILMGESTKELAFSPFPRLPLELRRMIWLVAAQTPRVIEVSQKFILIRKLRQVYGMTGKIDTKFKGQIPPAILHATRESRSSALEVYTLLPFSVYETTIRVPRAQRFKIYVNLNVDVLYLRSSPLLVDKRHLRLVFLTNYAPFRRIRFDTRSISGSIDDFNGIDTFRMEDWVDDEGCAYYVVPAEINLLRHHQTLCVKALLEHAHYFSSNVEFVELIVDGGHAFGPETDTVQAALDGFTDNDSLGGSWQFVKTSTHNLVEEPGKSYSISTRFLLQFGAVYLNNNI